MKHKRWITGLALLLCLLLPAQALGTGALYQVSTLQALMRGDYYGAVTVGDLLTQGDTGLGTFDALDGEMIVLDGVAYRAAYDGSVAAVGAEETSPFANVTFLGAGEAAEATFEGGFDGLLAALSALVPDRNLPVVFRVAGTFTGVTVRSVPAQAEPYAPLTEVVKNQAVFTAAQAQGVIVGFRFPQYMGDINTAGYHLHFLSEDHTFGGHLLDVTSGEIEIRCGELDTLNLVLPESISLYGVAETTDAEIEAVESH